MRSASCTLSQEHQQSRSGQEALLSELEGHHLLWRRSGWTQQPRTSIMSRLPYLLQVAACCRSHLLACRSWGTWCPFWSEGGRWDDDSGDRRSLRRECRAGVGPPSSRRCLLGRGLALQLRRRPFCRVSISLQGEHPVMGRRTIKHGGLALWVEQWCLLFCLSGFTLQQGMFASELSKKQPQSNCKAAWCPGLCSNCHAAVGMTPGRWWLRSHGQPDLHWEQAAHSHRATRCTPKADVCLYSLCG